MEPFLNPCKLKRSIILGTAALRGWSRFFDAIAFQGMSGALIAPPIALELNKKLILVRKPEDKSHAISDCGFCVEGFLAARKYIIVDDFTESGATRRRIINGIRAVSPDAVCLGVLEVQGVTVSDLTKLRGKKYPLSHPNY